MTHWLKGCGFGTKRNTRGLGPESVNVIITCCIHYLVVKGNKWSWLESVEGCEKEVGLGRERIRSLEYLGVRDGESPHCIIQDLWFCIILIPIRVISVINICCSTYF